MSRHRSPLVALAAVVLLGACQETPVAPVRDPEAMEAARVTWGVVVGTDAPDPFDAEAARRLQATILARWGLRRSSFREARAYFAAALELADRDRRLAALEGLPPQEYAARVPAARALALVADYLEAVRTEESTARWWFGREPRRAFDRLLEFLPGTAPTGPEPLAVGRLTVPGWRLAHRCLVADLAGRRAWQTFVFEVSGEPSRLGIVRVRGVAAAPPEDR